MRAPGSPPVAPGLDETQSSAPMPNSRLLSAEGTCVQTPHYVRELASQTTKEQHDINVGWWVDI
jgi:hypothetical protein